MRLLNAPNLLLFLIFSFLKPWISMASSQCTENAPVLDASSGEGHVLNDLGGFRAYVSGDPKSKHVVLLISDVYGIDAPKLRKIADKVGASKFYCVVPDFFHGDPYVDNNPKRPLEAWLKDHPPQKGFEDAKLVIKALRKEHKYDIGVAGFCWGGKVAVEFAKNVDINVMCKAIVLLHPAFVTVQDIEKVKIPIAILAAEKDEITPPSLVKEFEKILAKKPKIPSLVKIFIGVSHGFSVRYNDEFSEKKAIEAQKDMLDWLQKYVE
ncbi:putative hydrolase related to dienelactone hydrolase protein [Dioscorea alata]|uniref:Hydrolase related to dienelactone hydrolase protein n=1 Tax=Dioscorea alata TaxID=55571 RepID=A0ACB7VY42_DIOAL|nr:putative hydrolase related to dienelactone hydrolase protein [Dioscorea alata]